MENAKEKNAKEKNAKENKFIQGHDLKLMRLAAELTTSQMAALVGVKSRKTIENWESGSSEPGINQFLKYCELTKNVPDQVIKRVLVRGSIDPYSGSEANVVKGSVKVRSPRTATTPATKADFPLEQPE